MFYEGTVLPKYFKSLLPTKSVMVRRQKPGWWLLIARIPLLFGCRFFNRKILQITKPWEGSYLLKENESLCLLCRLRCERQEATKGHRGVVSLPLILSVPLTKAKPSAVQAMKQRWPKDFKRTYEECQTLLIKEESEQEESYSSLCNLYSAVKCTSL